MRNRTLPLLSVLGLFLIRQSVLANNIEPGKENYSAPRKTIVTDGNLSDWGGVPVFKNVKFSIPKAAPTQLVLFETLSGPTSIATDSIWSGPDDHSTAFAIAWDTDNLYIGVLVTDDYHEHAAAAAWNGDALQLLFADDARAAVTHLYNYALGGIEGALTDVIINDERGPGGTTPVIVRTGSNTVYEIKIPASALNLTNFQAGMKIGLGLCVNDGDEATPGQKGWSGWGVHSIVHGKTASEAGLVTLAGGPLTAPALEFNAEPVNLITVDGNLADWPGKEFRGPVPFEIPKTGGGTVVLFETLSGATTIAPTSIWDGPEDHTTMFSIAWETNALYIGLVVSDDYHEHAAGAAWNGDAVQVLFANAARDTITQLYNYALGGTEDALADVIINNEQGPGGTDAKIVRDKNKKKTYYELKFPAASLGLQKFEAGMKIGVGLCVNDGDLDTPGQKGWSGFGVHSIVHGKSPERAGLVTLVPAKAQSGLTFSAPPAPGFNTIDGDLSDWAQRPFIGPVPFAIPKTGGGTIVLFETLASATTIAQPSLWDGPQDHTSVLSMAWEKDALYIGVVVTDEYHEHAAGAAWNGDSLQVLFADAARTTVTHLYNYGLGGIDGALTDLIVNNERGPGGTQAAIARTGSNTVYEIRIPPSAIDLTEFTNGMQLGVGLCINDGDLDTPGQRGWSGFGVHSIVFGKTADRAGLLTLSAGGSTSRPQLAIASTMTNIVVSFTGTLQSSDRLSGATWTDVGTAASLGGKFTFPLTQAVLQSGRYYRSVNP